jgi:hypothetical protein
MTGLSVEFPYWSYWRLLLYEKRPHHFDTVAPSW